MNKGVFSLYPYRMEKQPNSKYRDDDNEKTNYDDRSMCSSVHGS